MIAFSRNIWCFSLFFLLAWIHKVVGVKLTFELPNNEKQCFYQDIEKGVATSLEYQVISGGRQDVDCNIQDPQGFEFYDKRKKQHDSYEWYTWETGVYKVCFSNEFSLITQKVVYFDWQYGEKPLLPEMERAGGLTSRETCVVNIHKFLNSVMENLQRFRLRKTTELTFSSSLCRKVQFWSFLLLIALLIVSIRKWGYRWYDEVVRDCSRTIKDFTDDNAMYYVMCMRNGKHDGELNRITDASSITKFRERVKFATTKEDRVILIWYDRMGPERVGRRHFFPVAGYNAKCDTVLLLDIARNKHPPFWLKLTDVWRTINTSDGVSGLHRGYIILRKAADGLGPDVPINPPFLAVPQIVHVKKSIFQPFGKFLLKMKSFLLGNVEE